ncbi:hypothetical protein CDAR_534781 [Caerostris darwini]|uniref:Uncharacterized protein n=1 Tax=Caerostris darwini TaxID=1538125 RepID=A0AAV4M5P3_9ARAC|nr:hypothetical protein CDAR_534781 [Caerostris darwini]
MRGGIMNPRFPVISAMTDRPQTIRTSKHRFVSAKEHATRRVLIESEGELRKQICCKFFFFAMICEPRNNVWPISVRAFKFWLFFIIEVDDSGRYQCLD